MVSDSHWVRGSALYCAILNKLSFRILVLTYEHPSSPSWHCGRVGQENNFRDEAAGLTARGHRKDASGSSGIEEVAGEFDLIVSSPLVRARQTAEIVAEALKFRQPLDEWDELPREEQSTPFCAACTTFANANRCCW